jgi:chemotaxis protein CheZ
MSKDLSAGEFRSLAREIGVYLENIASESSRIKANLNDVLIAQDFQDLTGQSIRRVILLVHDIEEMLINFIRITGRKSEPDTSAPRRNKSKLEGPQIPGKESADVMSCQDDVDDLLSSLGF